MKRMIFGALAASAGILLGPNAFGQSQTNASVLTEEPVLIELFTSQGCSSCPPADRLAQKLDREPDLVVISKPVDYWDRLGWKDTYAKPSNSDLQRVYARRGLGGYNGVYTPQSVVAGRYGEVGSKEAALRDLTSRARSTNRAVIRLKPTTGGFGVGLGGTTDRAADLVLVGVSSREDVKIGRGENGGRTVTYTNVLIDEKRIATWSGGTASHALKSSQMRMAGADRYALVLREPDGGPVLAARWVE
ncbi:thioredoxin family protein [Erythrobacter sp. YT30]|uniref:DUF1223 domain-containing protein n=1 Tax=Erythrobacter sp. YT30 TaxID=1735012 RepID=UPI00076C7059|nr:DUF1223 domain-containing protein [Erythrobacter sp. YT30]KWV91518.1 hypothetical protein AUC45_09775 [Erythrobacter sp. YT30]